MTAVLVQPFGLLSPGGGPKILRSLLLPGDGVLSICTAAKPPPKGGPYEEMHLPAVQALSLLADTRLAAWREVRLRHVQRRLLTGLLAATDGMALGAVHGLGHSPDFHAARMLAAERGCPFILSVHDDIRYALAGHPWRRRVDRQFADAWKSAQQRFVISDALGAEYEQRYGRRPWSVITDGAEGAPTASPGPSNTVHFMGAAHLSYEPNFTSLLDALELGNHGAPSDRPTRLVCRGSSPEPLQGHALLETRPWTSDDVVQEELRSAGVLYLPLPFARSDQPLTRFSLPTKMISYLAAGRPVLYHGPAHSPAGQLLTEFAAGVCVTSLHPRAVAAGLDAARQSAPALAVGARRLLHERFDLRSLQARFRDALGLVPHGSELGSST